MPTTRPEFWMDVGGTFTDCLLRRGDGSLLRHKLLSSGITKGAVGAGSTEWQIVDPARSADAPGFWDEYELRLLDAQGRVETCAVVERFDPETGTLCLRDPLPSAARPGQAYELKSGEAAPLVGVRQMLRLRLNEAIPPIQLRLGTTRGTNALLTRSGAKTALVTTAGFGDALRIGNQDRPRLFDLAIRKPLPLFADVLEIEQRVTADGSVLVPLDADRVEQQLVELRQRGVESLAICLLNSYQNQRHEQEVAAIASQVGFAEISVSSDVAPVIKLISRGDTTVVEAYLNPVLRAYVADLQVKLPGSEVRLLTSAGGLVSAERFSGKDSILSGPAGGVVGFSRVAQAAGFQRAIGFDMGGTSTDVARFDGQFRLQYECVKAGTRIVAPMMDIETVAAGGGSVCRFDGVKLAVGPESAGADPGPACYGCGGPLAVTDVNFFLGKIPARRFPFPLDRDAVERRLTALRNEIADATGTQYSPAELAEGFVRVANANMAQAIRSISIAQGADLRDYVLVAFGGAAGQHACAVARQLGLGKILIHPDAGILSAHGIGVADIVRHRVRGVYRQYSQQALADLEALFEQLTEAAAGEVAAEGVAGTNIEVTRSLDVRYLGLDAFLTIAQPPDGDYAAAFVREHQRRYGYQHEGRPLEMVAARVAATGTCGHELPRAESVAQRTAAEPDHIGEMFFDRRFQSAPQFLRPSLRPGNLLYGPALVAEATSTTIVDPGWSAEVLSGGELLLVDGGGPAAESLSTECDPVLLEVFNGALTGIAEQMGITLRNTAGSVNVKERLDFSCALFTADGKLVVNAPHIPVHLGAMEETVRCLLADNPDLRPGDVLVTNDPYRGGSHLPDVTVVTPVHNQQDRLLFFTASRAHHAEIGGSRPGSMPPFSHSLAEEGVIVRNFRLCRAGDWNFAELERLLLESPYPTRNVSENLADIRAQAAANRQGVADLLALVERFGWEVVDAYMHHTQQSAATKMRSALARQPQGARSFTDFLDDGSAIRVSVSIGEGRGCFDFTGTDPPVAGNLNANRAIVTAALLYCMRLLIDEDIPLNHGVLEPLELILPECLLNPSAAANPAQSPAVVGGNVETSQRVVDVILGALELCAASQGTMNNLLFGNERFGYYETIGGGSGATADAPGADAVHCHMTNTRLTDPEVLEQRFPVRVEDFSIRRGSGGGGRHRGGDGIVRKLRFLESLEVSLLTGRREPYRPYGMAGGQPGRSGKNQLVRSEGSTETLPAFAQVRVEPGDLLIVETPGGGGYGKP